MNLYLVIYENCDGELMTPVIESARQIFSTMDMSDCHGITIKRMWLIDGYKLIECRFRGTWHDPKEPLKMVIEAVCPATIKQMNPFDIGYGTDH